jgi:uncharacterized protein involved in outer membrane biogenesis
VPSRFAAFYRIPAPIRWVGGSIALLVLAIVLFLWWFNWNMLRGPIAREASIISGRPISIQGDLKVHLLTWTPTASVGGLKVGNPAWMKGGDLADVGTLTVSVKLLPLLVGRLELPLVSLDKPVVSLFRDADDRANWRSDQSNKKPAKLPPIQRFVIHDGKLKWVDQKRKLTIIGAIQSHEDSAHAGGGAFELNGNGTINTDPFVLKVMGGALLDVHHDKPYPFDADIRSGGTHVVAHGQVTKPFDFGQIRTSLMVSGTDLANLYDLTGLVFPNTPPYQLAAEVVRDEKVYTFSRLHGRVGGSDLEGGFKVDNTSGRPNVHADLRSRTLDVKDLGSLVGAPVPGERTTALQKTQAAQRAAESRLLPDATLNVSRVRKMDAVLHYRADSLIARPGLPLRHARLDLTLDHGVLTMDPISFSFPHGDLTGKVRLDATQDVPREDVDLRVTNVHIEDFMKKGAGDPPLEGTLEARAKLHGYGDSVHKAASTADGTVAFVVPHGKMRQAFAELLGVDVVKGLGLFLGKDQRETGVRCAVADFQAVHGVLQARNLVMDTDVVLANGKGNIDLNTEGLDLALQGHPKKFQILHLSAPITVKGHLVSPKFGVDAGKVAAQAGAAVALGALLGPVAVILPFVDAGLAKDADCVAMMGEGKQEGAPVKGSMTTPAKAKAK